MIITVTLNPALDKTATIDPLVAGGLNRIKESEIDAGGKGINVSKLILTLGGESIATGFVGGDTGDFLLRMLDNLSLKHDFIQAKGSTRINLKLLDKTNGITEVNDPGISASKEEEKALEQKLLTFLEKSPHAIFVLSGSTHKGASPEFYQELTKSLKAKGARVFLDADGDAFANALNSAPDFIKPNKEELLRYFKRDSENLSLLELKGLCQELIATKSVGLIALSLGPEGAIFVTKDKAAFAPGLKVSVSSTVGAGDSMVGAVAYAFANSYDFENTIKLAVAASGGAVTTEGTKAPSLECINTLKEQVNIEYI